MPEQSNRDDEHEGEGLFKKPLSGSFKRVTNQVKEEMDTKTGEQAIEDDLAGPAVKEEETANLERKVEEKKSQ